MTRKRRIDMGSKRRVQQIRWRTLEVVTVIFLAVLMAAFCIWLASWLTTHHFD
jgi:hypothetical protein